MSKNGNFPLYLSAKKLTATVSVGTKSVPGLSCFLFLLPIYNEQYPLKRLFS